MRLPQFRRFIFAVCWKEAFWRKTNETLIHMPNPCVIDWVERGRQVAGGSSNFRGLILGCIRANLCDQILIVQHSSRSTRLSLLIDTPLHRFEVKFFQIFVNFAKFKIFKILLSNFLTWFFDGPTYDKIGLWSLRFFNNWGSTFFWLDSMKAWPTTKMALALLDFSMFDF